MFIRSVLSAPVRRIRHPYSEKRAKGHTDSFGTTRLTELSAVSHAAWA